MEDVLDLYAEPYDPACPVVGFDERPLQLVAEKRQPLPTAPGRPQRYDYEYQCQGVGNVFTTVEPLAGWRRVEVTERRPALDFAQQMRWLVDEVYPEAEVIRVVLDNLNTHGTASLYAAFPAPEARRLARKLEFHHTPVHGCWLNIAECELAVLATQCLARRLPTWPPSAGRSPPGRPGATSSGPPSSGTSPRLRRAAGSSTSTPTRLTEAAPQRRLASAAVGHCSERQDATDAAGPQ